MAHFAQLDKNNVVQQVIVIANEDCGGGEFPSSEELGQSFISGLGLDGVAMPTEGGPWIWNEDIINWQEIPMSTT